ncbi:U3 small nucleolar ribonucleoprotein protein IMP3 isoform X1 [Zeugodacus cucurbitae]|uniref:U3 small nucleolar ribonucleoprotein protein IMP3 isoform X1 n=1 Tax=Zeugodacus cucurbitae TaxID=28588 RepID=UPI0023D96A44|nr:U3 small nucleolar ribonucleoprotein protein IMP3 isoform X1 [Zeugodacus cucurbitae]
MVRKLKYHEQKLLKKVDFITWKVDNGGKETKVIRRYHIRKPADYTKYNKLSREIRTLSEKIAKLENTDPFRTEAATMLLLKLYDMGLTRNQMDLAVASGVSASSFCRRRLPVVMVKSYLAEFTFLSCIYLSRFGNNDIGKILNSFYMYVELNFTYILCYEIEKETCKYIPNCQKVNISAIKYASVKIIFLLCTNGCFVFLESSLTKSQKCDRSD